MHQSDFCATSNISFVVLTYASTKPAYQCVPNTVGGGLVLDGFGTYVVCVCALVSLALFFDASFPRLAWAETERDRALTRTDSHRWFLFGCPPPGAAPAVESALGETGPPCPGEKTCGAEHRIFQKEKEGLQVKTLNSSLYNMVQM